MEEEIDYRVNLDVTPFLINSLHKPHTARTDGLLTNVTTSVCWNCCDYISRCGAGTCDLCGLCRDRGGIGGKDREVDFGARDARGAMHALGDDRVQFAAGMFGDDQNLAHVCIRSLGDDPL